jgi:hypothetical protein
MPMCSIPRAHGAEKAVNWHVGVRLTPLR